MSDKPVITASGFIGKHSSEYPPPEHWRNITILGSEVGVDDLDGICILQVPNPVRGGADAVVVISKDGVWIRGLEERVNQLVAKALKDQK